MKKKLLALLLTCVMITAGLSGCSSGKSDSSSADSTGDTQAAVTNAAAGGDTAVTKAASSVKLKQYKMAIPFPDSGATYYTILSNNLKNLGKLTNGSFVYQSNDFTADSCIAFVEGQIAAGVKGLIIVPPADSVLPTVTQLCADAGVYWGIAFRSIADDDIRKIVEASPYYVGNCYEDEQQSGYNVMKYLGEKGMKKVAIISTTKGDTTGDAREVGLNKAAKEYGMKVVGEARGLAQASDATSATESFLSANPDLDCVFVVGTTATGVHEAVVKAIQDAGRADKVKMASIDFPDGMVSDFKSGVQVYACGLPCLTYDPYMEVIKVVNAIQGYPLAKTFTSNSMSMYQIDSLDKAKEFMDVVGNENFKFFEDDYITKNLLKWNNADLNQDSLQTIISAYNPVQK